MNAEASLVSKASVQSIQVETQRVIKRLRETQEGDLVPWDELESLTGCHDRTRLRSMWQTAQKTLLKELLHFRVEAGVGIERASHRDVVREALPSQRKRVGSASRKLVKTTKALDLSVLPEEDKVSAILHQTIGELTSYACSKPSLKILATGMESSEPPTLKEVFRRYLEG